MFRIVSSALLVAALTAGYMSGNQPRRNAVAFAEEQLDITLESRRIVVGELELNVVLAGPKDGAPVVLLHGYPEFWYAWRGPMAVLARAGFRVIVPDQRGYNDSDKPKDAGAYALDRLAGDVVGLLDALGYEKAYLAGHDFGGLVAWWTLILHPDRIEKFVIVNKPHPQAILDHSNQESQISWYRTFLRIPWIPGYVGRLGNWGLLVKNLRQTAQSGTFSEDHMNQFRSAWDNDGAIHSMGAWYRANANFDLDVDKEIALPGLFVLAPNDAFSAKELGVSTLEFIPKGKLIELQQGTHWVIQEQPQQIGGLLVTFFSSDRDSETPETSERNRSISN